MKDYKETCPRCAVRDAEDARWEEYRRLYNLWVDEYYAIENRHSPVIARLGHISNTDRAPFHEAQRRRNDEVAAHFRRQPKAPTHVEPVPSDK